MKRFIAFMMAVCAVPLAIAVGTSAHASWTAPTTYTDGSALPASDIASYTMSWAPAGGQAGPSGSINVAATATTATVPVACGSVTFTIAVTTTATAKYPSATSSPSSGVPYATGVTCSPNPPAGLTVN